MAGTISPTTNMNSAFWPVQCTIRPFRGNKQRLFKVERGQEDRKVARLSLFFDLYSVFCLIKQCGCCVLNQTMCLKGRSGRFNCRQSESRIVKVKTIGEYSLSRLCSSTLNLLNDSSKNFMDAVVMHYIWVCASLTLKL